MASPTKNVHYTAGGEGCRSAATKSLRVRDLYCSVSSSLSACKGPAASVQGCATIGSKSLPAQRRNP